MVWGKYETQFEAHAKKTGKIPPALDRKPEIFEDLDGIHQAFWQLSASRPLGGMGGQGFIPLPAIESYIRMLGLPGPVDVDEFIYLVTVMDAEYIKNSGKK